VFTAETVDGRVIATGDSLYETHGRAMLAFRSDRSIREAFISQPDDMVWLMMRPKIANLYFDRSNIAAHRAEWGV
jgi:hypothetical protein